MSTARYGEPSRPAVWVCVPTYNEAENVSRLVGAVLDELSRLEVDPTVLVIDDASPDGTGAIADALAEHDTRVRVLHRPGKEGIGPAYRDGFRLALAEGAERIIEMDCDFSHDPAVLGRLIGATDSADLALGSRYVPGGTTVNWGLVRRAISRGGCIYAKAVLRVPVQDLTGGFKCFRRAVLEAIPLDQVAAAGYVFQVEMTYRAILLGFTVVEVPITFTDRVEGTSKMSRRIVLEAATRVPRLRRLKKGTPSSR